MSLSRLHRSSLTYATNDTQYELGNGPGIAYRILCKVGVGIILSILTLLGLSSCSGEPTPYRPPSSDARVTITLPAGEVPASTSQPIEAAFPTIASPCTDSLTFLEDLSIPDGSVVKPDDRLDKRWLIQNSGTCNWDERYRLKLVSGEEMGAPIEQALYPARNGAKATLRITFTAPSGPGTYQSTWQAFNPQGQAFGDPIDLQVVVINTGP